MALVARSFSSASLYVGVGMVESIFANQGYALWSGAMSAVNGSVDVVGGGCCRCSRETCLAGVGLACVEAVVGGLGGLGGTSRLATVQPGSAILTGLRHLWLAANFGGRSPVPQNISGREYSSFSSLERRDRVQEISC